MATERRAPFASEVLLAYAAAGAVAVGLKRAFGEAGAEELYWMLAPLTQLVELLSGIDFYWEPPAGFVSNSARIIIAPSCSGITFLVVCFSTLAFPLLHRRRGMTGKLGWLVLALCAAYLATLGANTVRVTASIHLYGADIYGARLTSERAHRLLGTALYLGLLLPVYLLVERATRREAAPARSAASPVRFLYPPFACYALFAIAIPLLRASGRAANPALAEHLLTVGLLSAVAFALCLLALVLLRAGRVDLPGGGRENA